MSNAVAGSRIDEFRAAYEREANAGSLRDDGLEAYAVDGMVPNLAVSPGTESELATALRVAHELGLSVIAVGGGGHRSFGNVPTRYDVAISTARLNRIVAYEAADLTVTVEAGVRLKDVQAQLATQNQFLPLDPPCGDESTIGGLIASGAYGPLRHAHGTVRDWLIGLRVAHADGRVSKAGGRVVKNVTGYEMTKVYAGSLGTLGVISQATFKLMPRPAVTRTHAVRFHSAHAAATLGFAARDAGLELEALELLSPTAAFRIVEDAGWTVLMRAAGTTGGVARSLREVDETAGGLRGTLVDVDDGAWLRWNDTFASGELSLTVSVPPSSTVDVIDVLDRRFAGAEARLSATPGAGVVRATLRPASDDRAAVHVAHAREAAERYGGYVVVDAAPEAYKREHDVFGPLRPDFAIMKRLKDEFDPRRTLSPGRFAGRL